MPIIIIMVYNKANHMGSKPKLIATGIIIGMVVMMIAMLSMKHFMINMISNITTKMPMEPIGNPVKRLPRKSLIPVIPVSEEKATPPTPSHMIMAFTLKVVMSADTRFFQVSFPRIAVAMTAPAAPTPPASLGVTMPE